MLHLDPALNARVPQELVEMMINHLRSDIGALKACCVVNKTWVARSRYHLFYQVEILDDTQLHSWASTFRYPANDVGGFVRRLHIAHPRMLEDVSEFSLEQFTNVEYFSLGDVPDPTARFQASGMINILPLPTTLRSIRLCLERIQARGISSLFQRFRNLEDLSIVCPQRGIEDAITLESSPKLWGELKIVANNDLTCFATLLGNLPNGIRFTRANISIPLEQPQTINTLLQSLAHALTSLSIECSPRNFLPSLDASRSGVFIDLSPLLNLTTLGFRLDAAYVTPATVSRAIESAVSGVSDIQLTFVHLRNIREWAPVDDAIAALASRSLRPLQVTVNGFRSGVGGSFGYPLKEEDILPKVTSMGLLQVGWRGLSMTWEPRLRREFIAFAVKGLFEGIDVLSIADEAEIVENLGAIVSASSLFPLISSNHPRRPEVTSDLFEVVCGYRGCVD